jgi:hypothetical protein
MARVGLISYLLFTASWFLHLTARVPALGIVRFDLVLIAIGVACIAFRIRENGSEGDGGDTGKFLKILIAYVVVTIPFVEWPGSVLRTGLERFVKAAVFFYFTKSLLMSEKDLKVFISVFIGCQCVRVLEPLYLNLTEGYMGERAYMSGEFLDRLAGAPHDVIGANGLAFVILTIVPFLYFLGRMSLKLRSLFLILTPILLYALSLTGSRSGFLGLIAILVGLVLKSRRKIIMLVVIAVVGSLSFAELSDERKDRFLSVFDRQTKSAATAEGRIEGVREDFRVALQRPIFGHGLGTSMEANYNVRGGTQLAHNLWAEVAQELGFLGLSIFIAYILSVVALLVKISRRLQEGARRESFLVNIHHATQVWLGMALLFSFASYGLSSYEWYLFPALAVVLGRTANQLRSTGQGSDCNGSNAQQSFDGRLGMLGAARA